MVLKVLLVVSVVFNILLCMCIVIQNDKIKLAESLMKDDAAVLYKRITDRREAGK